jgi:hypothetical protein
MRSEHVRNTLFYRKEGEERRGVAGGKNIINKEKKIKTHVHTEGEGNVVVLSGDCSELKSRNPT